MQRLSYFLLGIVFTIAAIVAAALWDSTHEFKFLNMIGQVIPWEKPALKAEDLTGKWAGNESRGATYSVVRKSDGTFSEFHDYTHQNGPHPPLIITSSGCWSLSGSQYSYYYTKSTDSSLLGRGPWIRTLTSVSPAEFTYLESEGNEVTEKKE
jgi:hypothetical protein